MVCKLPRITTELLAWYRLLCGALLVLLPTLAFANPRQDAGFARARQAAHHKDPQDVHYKYQYSVDDPASGVVNDRWEQRSGDFVKGQYSLLDPDGKVRTVDYEVDGERGFHAVIRTQYPPPALLSIQSASQVNEVYQESPVNTRAKSGLDVPEFALRNPRFSVRDNLPFNYHALDAAKLGIDTEDDGTQLQLLDDAGPLSPREAHRRKYHRENHLLPHEQLAFQDLQDQSVQQDTRQDLHEPSGNALLNHDTGAYAPHAPLSVFNPRASYMTLHPGTPRPPHLPPPNPPPTGDLLPPPLPTEAPIAPASASGTGPGGLGAAALFGVPASAPAAPAFYPLPLSAPSAPASTYLFPPTAGYHTLALLHPPPPHSPTQSSLTSSSTRLLTARSAGRPRVFQHLTETSPGLLASRGYYLR